MGLQHIDFGSSEDEVTETAVHWLLEAEVKEGIDEVGPVEVSVNTEHLSEDGLADLNEIDGGLTPDQISQARAKAHDMEQVVIRAVTARGCSGWDGEFDEFPAPPPPKLQRFCH